MRSSLLVLLACWTAACAAAPAPRAEPPPPARAPTEDPAALAAERARQERENQELLAWRAARAREEADAAARKPAEPGIKVTRLGEATVPDARETARLEQVERDRATEEARAKVARARAVAGVAGPSSGTKGGGRPAGDRLARTGLSGLLCSLDARRAALARELRAARRGGADAGRLAPLRDRDHDLTRQATTARARLRALKTSRLPCGEARTAGAARCFTALAAGAACRDDGSSASVEAVRKLDGGG